MKICRIAYENACHTGVRNLPINSPPYVTANMAATP